MRYLVVRVEVVARCGRLPQTTNVADMSHDYYIYAEVDYRRERATESPGSPRAARRRPSLVRRLLDAEPRATRRKA